MGAALAVAFKNAGFQVYATARDPSKMSSLSRAGILTLPLDITSPASMAACAAKIPSLHILVNNAGVSHSMPVSDLDIDDAMKSVIVRIFSDIDLFWSKIDVIFGVRRRGYAVGLNPTP